MAEESKMPAIIPRIFYTILFMLGVGLYIGAAGIRERGLNYCSIKQYPF
jgi:hypothetical protein